LRSRESETVLSCREGVFLNDEGRWGEAERLDKRKSSGKISNRPRGWSDSSEGGYYPSKNQGNHPGIVKL